MAQTQSQMVNRSVVKRWLTENATPLAVRELIDGLRENKHRTLEQDLDLAMLREVAMRLG